MSDDGACPICLALVPLNYACEWDNGEPAPNSGSKTFMNVCATCHKGVYGEITPAQWVTASVTYERRNASSLRDAAARLLRAVEDFVARVP